MLWRHVRSAMVSAWASSVERDGTTMGTRRTSAEPSTVTLSRRLPTQNLPSHGEVVVCASSLWVRTSQSMSNYMGSNSPATVAGWRAHIAPWLAAVDSASRTEGRTNSEPRDDASRPHAFDSLLLGDLATTTEGSPPTGQQSVEDGANAKSGSVIGPPLWKGHYGSAAGGAFGRGRRVPQRRARRLANCTGGCSRSLRIAVFRRREGKHGRRILINHDQVVALARLYTWRVRTITVDSTTSVVEQVCGTAS